MRSRRTNKQPGDAEANSPFSIRLSRNRLLALPNGVYLLSNRSDCPPNSVLEIQITKEISRHSLWEKIVQLQLNGRTFRVFPDYESLELEKNQRLKFTPTSGVVQ